MTKQKNWLVILAITAFVGVLVATAIRLLIPKQVVVSETDFISQNQDGSSTNFSQISFSGAPPTPVNSLPIVNIVASQTTLDYVKNSLIEKQGLKPLENLDRFWVGDKYSLYYEEQTDSYFFTYSYDMDQEKLIANVDQAISAAHNFIKETFPNIEVVPQTENIKYFEGGRHVDETTLNNANYVLIPFTYGVENFPAYVEKRETPVFLITINAENQVQRVVFQPLFLDITIGQKVKTIQIDEALENINNNQASVVSAYETVSGVFTLDEIVDGVLTEVVIEYRLDPVSGLGYPFYRFKGELENNEGKIITAEIITPAVVVR